MVSSVKSEPNHYETLGLTPGASARDVSEAYATRIHKHLVPPDEADENSRDEARRLMSAYKTLSDPDKRQAYDASLSLTSAPEPQGQSAAPADPDHEPFMARRSRSRTERRTQDLPASLNPTDDGEAGAGGLLKRKSRGRGGTVAAAGLGYFAFKHSLRRNEPRDTTAPVADRDEATAAAEQLNAAPEPTPEPEATPAPEVNEEPQAIAMPASELDEGPQAIAAPASELEAEPIAAPASELEAEPIAAPASELEAEPTAAPASDLEAEAAAAPPSELEAEPAAAPASELEPEPTAAPEPGAEPEPSPAMASNLDPDPSSAPEPHLGPSDDRPFAFEDASWEADDDASWRTGDKRRPTGVIAGAALLGLGLFAVSALLLSGYLERPASTSSESTRPSLEPPADWTRAPSNAAPQQPAPEPESFDLAEGLSPLPSETVEPIPSATAPTAPPTAAPAPIKPVERPPAAVEKPPSVAAAPPAARPSPEPPRAAPQSGTTATASPDELAALPPPAAAAPTPRPVVTQPVNNPPAAPVVRVIPRRIAGGIGNSDNPGGRLQGTVNVRFTVERNGQVSGCRTVASSGNPALGARTCQLVQQRLRFTPALDAQGQPIPWTMGATYTWGRKMRGRRPR
jgi:TonB family protein